MDAKEFIDIIMPEHERTSCSDSDINNGFYSNTYHCRCFRCCLLQALKEGSVPKSHTFRGTVDIDGKLAAQETKHKWMLY